MKSWLDVYGLALLCASVLASKEGAWWLGPLVFAGGIAAIFLAITLWYGGKVAAVWLSCRAQVLRARARFELACWRARRRGQ